LAALVVMIAQLAGSAHEATTRHVMCAHGELVDAPDSTALPAAHTTARITIDPLQGVPIGHDHCSIASALRHHTQLASDTAAPACFDLVSELAAASTPTLVTHSIYRFAPKTSPPDHDALFITA
jgi:hypothetical protein